VLAPTPAASSNALNGEAHGYTFGEFRLDVSSRTLSRNGTDVPLPSRAFDALVYLIERRDRLVRKNELVEAIWHDVVVTDDSLVHAISVLRRALADEPNRPRYVQTVPRRGYRFVAPVRASVETIPPDAHVATGSRATRTGATEQAAGPPTPPGRSRAWARRFAWPTGVAAGLALVLVAAWVVLSRPAVEVDSSRTTRTIRLFQPPPDGTTIVSGGVLSPDGSSLAFAARDNVSGRATLWVRMLRSSDLKSLEHTEGASKPFWSPDARRIGFFANGKLMTIDTASGDTRAVANGGASVAGGTWAPDDTILFADWAKGIFSVNASGGEPTEVVALDRAAQDIVLSWPQFLPDGRHFLYHVVSLDRARTGAYIGDLDTRRSFRLIDTESPAVFAPPRHILHIERELLIAEEFDARNLELTGRATVLARDVSPPSLANENVVSAAGDLMAYRHGGRQQQLVWLDRAGEVVGTVSMPAVMFNPRVSPDGSRLLATSSVTTNPGLWLASLSRAEFERLEVDAIAPLWSPDGTQIAFTARGGFDLLVRSAAGGPSYRLISSGVPKILNDWSPNGDHIVYTQEGDGTKLDLWGVRLMDGAVFPVLATPFNEMQARLSPDGRWIAYVSDETGTLEVFVQRYPELDERYKVSETGGGQPQWRRDQRELFYMASDGTLVAVPVSHQDQQPRFGKPRRLFRAPIAGGPDNARDYYAATADGGKFLVDGAVGDVKDGAITVVVHWPAESNAVDGAIDSRRLE
jgi:eukaryotic-like serine/threonine-protein kinase